MGEMSKLAKRRQYQNPQDTETIIGLHALKLFIGAVVYCCNPKVQQQK